MAQVTKINGVTITNHIKIGQDGQPGYMATAILGSPGSSTVIIDDPDAELDIETWQDYTVDETDCSFQRLFTGIIYSRKVIRGPYRSGVSRQWELEVVDMGQLLAQRVITGADGDRPEEDDTDRVAWLVGSPYLSGLVYDNGFVSSTNPQNMFTSDHRGETPMELLVSLAGEHFKNAYVYYDESAGQPSLFYGPAEDTLGVATIGFSNVPGDADHSSIFEPSIDAETEMAGEDRYGGIFLRSPAGDIYRQKTPTITAMHRTRDVVFSSDRIGRAATAEQVASDLLSQHADDLQTVRFTAELPSSKVNLARPGMTMDVTFEHVPGYESGVTVFVQSTIIQQKMVGHYIVQFVVAPNPKAPLVGTGGDPNDYPATPCDSPPSRVQISAVARANLVSGGTPSTYDGPQWPVTPTEGNLLLALWFVNWGMSIDDMPGWTLIADAPAMFGGGGTGGSVHAFYKVAGASEVSRPQITSFSSLASSADNGGGYLVEITGTDTVDSFVTSYLSGSSTTTPGATITPSAGVAVYILTYLIYHTSLFGRGTPKSGVTEVKDESRAGGGDGNPNQWIGEMAVTSASGSYDVNPTFGSPGYEYSAVTIAFACSGGGPPRAGQWVFNEFVANGDGTTVTFTTAYAYARRSLHVFVDGVPIVNGLTETDPTAGTFTLDFAPKAASGDTRAERVTVNYQAI